MKGLTNAISQSGGGGGGDTISAVNKSGSAIREGDKVWLNNNAHTAGQSIKTSGYIMTSMFYPGVITPDGNTFVTWGNFYNVGLSEIKQIGTYNRWSGGARPRTLNNGMMFGTDLGSGHLVRLDYPNNWGSYQRVGYLLNEQYTYFLRNINKVNMDTGEILYSVASGIANTYSLIMINNTIYDLANANKYVLTDNGESLSISQGTYNNMVANINNIPLGKTKDNKYITTVASYDASRFDKILNFNVETETLTQAELPADMQPFAGTSASVYWNGSGEYLVFYNNQTKEYGIFKYTTESGFVKVPFTLPADLIPYDYTNWVFSINDSGDRVGLLTTPDNNKLYPTVVFLDSANGYSITKYSPFNISENSLTGKASQDIPSGGTGEVTTILAD